MLFLKKKLNLSSFIRIIVYEVLKVPPYTYEDYLVIDPDSALSVSEFDKFIDNLPFLRLSIIFTLLKDSKNNGQIKASVKDLDKTFNQALLMAYQDNNVNTEEAQRLTEVFSWELKKLESYIESTPDKDLSEKGYTPYACLYFNSKFIDLSEESIRSVVYIELINNQRKLIKEYYWKALKKLKITD